MKLFHSILFLLVLSASFAAAQTTMQADLDSAYLIKGESTRLSLYVRSNTRPTSRPGIPVVDSVNIQFLQAAPRLTQNRERVYVYTYNIRSFEEGTHTIPGFSMQIGGQLLESQPVSIHVHPLDVLTWNTQTKLGPTFRYASAVFIPEKSPYVGETFPAEVKVYLPDNTGGSSNGVAELDHDGVVAWRFEAIRANTRVQLPSGGHSAIIFRSTASPIRSGAVSLGGGTARIMVRVRRSERGFTIVQDVPAEFELPKRTLQARALPPGAPAGFDGAVGTFDLSVAAEVEELEDGDPISLRLNIAGTGNLDSLPAPRLIAPEGAWKVYEPSRLERQGERRDVSGQISFSQIIRPLSVEDQVPPFELVYFNPTTASYATTRSKPIPFTTKPSPFTPGSAALIPTLATPVEDMQGILSVIDPLRPQPDLNGSHPLLRLWQVIPALLAIFLLFRLAQRVVFPRFQTSERERQIHQSLTEVSKAGDSESEFLRAAAAFVERWIPVSQREGELADILHRRDTDCFRPDHAGRLIEPEEKKSLLRTLKDRALSTLPILTLLATLFLSSPAPATAAEINSFETAESSYLSGNFRTALDLYSSAPEPHSADVLYNIGNCHYKLNAPGQAALFYHRALLLNPQHPEARQNLRFLERSQGSISIVRKPYEETLALLSLTTYRTLAIAGAWITGLSILALVALSSGKLLSAITLSCGLLLGATGMTCTSLYPTDAEFAPPSERAVTVNSTRIKGRTEASEAGPKAIDIPPGSLCRILAPRGSWTYVEFPNQTRAWLPASQVESLTPSDADPSDRL